MSGQVRASELDLQLRDQFQQISNHSSGSGLTDAFGTISYAAPAPIDSRVEEDIQVIETPGGNKRTTTHRICTEGRLTNDRSTLVTFTMRDRFWLPGDDETDDSLAREPAAIFEATGEFGEFSHWEILV